MSHVMSFKEFINESKINEMRRRSYGRSYRGGYGSANGSAEYYHVNPKDERRAIELSDRRINTNPNLTDEQVAIGNAKKMSKLITDPGKMIARMEAVYNRWGAGPVLQPFIDRILDMVPHPKYKAAWEIGLKDGAVGANPEANAEDNEDSVARLLAGMGLVPQTEAFRGNSAEQIIYQVAYNKAYEEELARI